MALAPRGTRDPAVEAAVRELPYFRRFADRSTRLPADCIYRATPSGGFFVERVAAASGADSRSRGKPAA